MKKLTRSQNEIDALYAKKTSLALRIEDLTGNVDEETLAMVRAELREVNAEIAERKAMRRAEVVKAKAKVESEKEEAALDVMAIKENNRIEFDELIEFGAAFLDELAENESEIDEEDYNLNW